MNTVRYIYWQDGDMWSGLGNSPLHDPRKDARRTSGESPRHPRRPSWRRNLWSPPRRRTTDRMIELIRVSSHRRRRRNRRARAGEQRRLRVLDARRRDCPFGALGWTPERYCGSAWARRCARIGSSIAARDGGRRNHRRDPRVGHEEGHVKAGIPHPAALRPRSARQGRNQLGVRQLRHRQADAHSPEIAGRSP